MTLNTRNSRAAECPGPGHEIRYADPDRPVAADCRRRLGQSDARRLLRALQVEDELVAAAISAMFDERYRRFRSYVEGKESPK
jgi:hypothetical protein